MKEDEIQQKVASLVIPLGILEIHCKDSIFLGDLGNSRKWGFKFWEFLKINEKTQFLFLFCGFGVIQEWGFNIYRVDFQEK